MSESVLRIVIDSRNAERNARNLSRELNSIERTGNHASSSMDSMSVATRNLAGYMMGLVTVGTAISKMDMYTGLQNRLKLVTDSQAELNTAMSDTFGIAQKTAATWDSVAMVYQRFADNADRLGISMKTTAELTETVSKAISVSGGSAASAEAALMQFGQALASGVLRGEEFNSIAEQAPGLLKAIAFGLDTNVGALRAMAQDGEITGDVLVESLGKAKPYIDDLFNKTDFTIAQEFTRLSNEVTKFVGEAGKGTGAASALGSAIGMLSQNLGTIADIAVVGGVAMLTKFIIAQTVAMQGSITASIARRAADATALQSQVQLAAVEVQRTRNKVGELAAEQNLIVAKLRTNLATKERIALETRATQVAIQLAVAERNMTAATAQRTIAQNTLNASMSAGSRILGLVGGWTGVLTIGVAALAAGYMYLKNRTAEANAKLEEQGKVALETDESLKKLSGNDKISAVQNLTAAFDDQNKKLAESKAAVDAVLFAIRASSVENEKARKVTEDAKNGVISYDEAIKRLNNMDIPTDLYDTLKKQVIQYDENAEKAGKSQHALGLLGKTVELTGNLFQNSAVQVAGNTKELIANETAAQKAAKAQKEYFGSLHQDVLSANERLAYMNLGFSREIIDQINKLQEAKQKALGDGVTAIITTEEINKIVQAQKALDAVKNKEDEITEAKKKQNKESAKRYQYTQAELKMLQKVTTLSAKHDLDGIGAKYGIPKNYLAGLMAQESKGNPNAVSPTGAIGYFQTTSAYRKDNGLSIADSKNLPVVAEVVAKNLAKAYKELGNWEAAIRSHNAGLAGSAQFAKSGKVKGSAERNKEVANFAPAVNKWIVGLGGSALKNKGVANPFDDLKEYSAFLEEQTKKQKAAILDVAKYEERINLELAEKIKNVEAAGFSPEETKRLTAEYQARADNEIAIAKRALKTKLDDYAVFKKTESELLKDSFDEKKFYAAHDLELSKEDQKKAVALLDEQYQHELALIELAKEQQLFQAQQSYMHEVDAMRERYRLERIEIAKIKDEKQKAGLLNASYRAEDNDYETKRRNAWDNYRNMSAARDGTGEFLQLDFAKENASKNIEDSVKHNLITEQQAKADLLKVEEDYQKAKLQLSLTYGEKISESMADSMATLFGEQSGAYKAMFAVQKGFAIAQSTIAIQQGIANAMSLPFPTNLAAAATVAAETASVLSNIKAVTMVAAGDKGKGFANGGYTGRGGKYEPAGIVHKGEGVLTQEEIAALGGPQGFNQLRASIKNGYSDGGLVKDTSRISSSALSAISASSAVGLSPELKVNIINNVSNEVEAKVTQTKDGLTIEMVRKDVVNQLNDSNSQISKALDRTRGTRAVR